MHAQVAKGFERDPSLHKNLAEHERIVDRPRTQTQMSTLLDDMLSR